MHDFDFLGHCICFLDIASSGDQMLREVGKQGQEPWLLQAHLDSPVIMTGCVGFKCVDIVLNGDLTSLSINLRRESFYNLFGSCFPVEF